MKILHNYPNASAHLLKQMARRKSQNDIVVIDDTDEETDSVVEVMSAEDAENEHLIVKLWFAGVPLILLKLIHLLIPNVEVCYIYIY